AASTISRLAASSAGGSGGANMRSPPPSEALVAQVVPVVQRALAEAAEGRERTRLDAVERLRVGQRRVVDREIEHLAALARDALGHAPPRVRGEAHAVAAVAEG